MVKIDSTSSTNALQISFEGKDYLFMGNVEDFSAEELEKEFTYIAYALQHQLEQQLKF